MDPDQALKSWPAPDSALPQLKRPRRSWWTYAGITLVVVLWLAGVALVAFFVMLIVGLSLVGNNK